MDSTTPDAAYDNVNVLLDVAAASRADTQIPWRLLFVPCYVRLEGLGRLLSIPCCVRLAWH